ncbi:MAG TPA: DNA-directed RNA polymerase subunit beta' [Spirochaetota bacterium]|nr:DNA-directed RNA polymerase subunit beta' [Spirochaetota bacterium]
MPENLFEYGKIKIGIASPNTIRSWSFGEVLRPETINYRTLRPEKDGLFCERIFGTTKEWECFCGKFKSIRYKGVVCDRCGVEVTHFKVRRERMGHIELSCPAAHIWFYKAVPSRIGLLLDMSIITLKSVIYYEKYIIVDPGDVPGLKKYDLKTEEEYYKLREEYGDSFRAGIGAEIIKDILMELDLEEEEQLLREKMNASRAIDKRKLIRMSIIEDFANSSNKPEWMVLDVIPVIPPELRPMVQLEGGRFATSDLNDLYRRLINRNNRLKKLMALKAPEIIIKNEKRMLQEAVDALLDNSRRKRTVKGAGNRPLKSLSDVLKGKQGRFRQNLLGKRVDYSGRSVIVVGPDLKLHQCGLPKKMALELFKPYIMRKLVEKKLVFNIKSAKKIIDNEYPEVWKILEDVVKEHPVVLNRAPTLHRLGMQAFEPILTDEKAIRLHPLVCTAYNADFDGDQMAVHVPLSSEAQIEAWTLMLSSKNLLDPANGEPICNPSQDMVLGAYNLTTLKKGAVGENQNYSSIYEAQKAMELGYLDIQAKIFIKYNNQLIESSLGRLIFSEILPEGMEPVTEYMNETNLKKIISFVFKNYSTYDTVVMLDKLKDISFHYSTLFGNTIAISDILIPDEKEEQINQAKERQLQIFEQYKNGVITDEERYQQIISLWTLTNDNITTKMMDNLAQDKNGHNNLYIMSTSGARGSRQQIRQLAGMRGLMAKPSGEIIELPIISNFKEGLSVLEYFISTHGARKGLSDTALKTADAGYLTRKLVDIAQDVTIEIEDCGTINGINIYPIKNGDEIIENLSDRVVGRFTAEPVINPYTNELILDADKEITPDIAKKIDEFELESIKIRTVVTCDSERGICRKCYGTNLAQGGIVDIGEPVGIMASQSIGQPGTQLTMRTFHIGGTASSEVKDPEFTLPNDIIILDLPKSLVRNKEKQLVLPRKGSMTIATVFQSIKKTDIKNLNVTNGQRLKAGEVIGVDKNNKNLYSQNVCFAHNLKKNKELYLISASYKQQLEVGAVFQVEKDKLIPRGDVIYKFDPYNEPIIAEKNGIVRYQDIILNKTLNEELDEMTQLTNKKIMESKEEGLQPKLIIVPSKGESSEADVPAGSILNVEDGTKVSAGDTLAAKIRTASKTSDITGGLPRVQELFEARTPVNSAVIGGIDGEIDIGATVKGKRPIEITNEFGDKVKHIVPSGKALHVRNGDAVVAGELLCEGKVNPHDILAVQGEVELYRYILENVQEVYKRQGVNINDKHIGVIIRQMLRKVEIIDPGDTPHIRGEIVDKYKLRNENKSVVDEGGQAAVAKSILLGLTKASLNTESFISAASFQETTKVLTNSAIKNVSDELRGLKENVIIGHKIPAGTGKKFYDNLSVYKNVIGDLDFIGKEEESEIEVKTPQMTKEIEELKKEQLV